MNQRRLWIVVLGCLLAATGCQGTAKIAATPSPAAMKPVATMRAPGIAPKSSSAPPPPEVHYAAATPSIRTQASPKPARPTPLPAPTDAPPRIISVKLNSTDVQSGDTIVGRVFASRNVASVEVRVANYGMTMTKVGAGRFELSYTVGSLPFFVHGTYDMQIIARNTRGDAVSQTIPLTIH
jgi:hypothetical protein